MSNGAQRPVLLNPDQTEHVLQEIQDLYSTIAHLSRQFRAGKLTEEMRTACFTLLEDKLHHIGRTMGYFGDLHREMEQRYAELRQANRRVHELERLVGSTRPLDGFAQLHRYLEAEIRSFWRTAGFGHVSSFAVTGGGSVHVTYGFALDKHLWSITNSETPVTNRRKHADWIKEVAAAGYIIVSDDGGRENALLDCDQNRRRIIELLTGRYPSLALFKWENLPLQSAEHPNGSLIAGLEVSIRDVQEIPGRRPASEQEDHDGN